MSQSLVNESGGARTPLSGLFAAASCCVVTLFFVGLAARPAAARAGGDRADGGHGPVQARGAAAAVAVQPRPSSGSRRPRSLGVLGSGILRGVLIGVVISLLLLLRPPSRPRTSVAGSRPRDRLFADRRAAPRKRAACRDVFVFRARGALLYFNVDHVRDRFFELLEARGGGVRLAVFFLGALAGRGSGRGRDARPKWGRRCACVALAFRLAEAHGDVRESPPRRAGFEEHVGPVVVNQPVATAIAEWR